MAVTYNAIELAFPETQTCVFGSVRDPSDTDQLYTSIEVGTRGVIGPDLIPSENGETPSETIVRIRHLLTSPRKPLLVTGPDGNTIIEVEDGLDDANGPKPDANAVSVTHLLEGSYLINFVVRTMVKDCKDNSGNLFLSHRWSDTVTTDPKTWCQTKHRVGRAIISSLSIKTADDLRDYVTPPIMPCYRRIVNQFNLDFNNLTLNYAFTDEQLVDPPPTPATSMTGSMRETMPMKGGIRQGELNITLTGPKAFPRSVLLAAAVRVGLAFVMKAGPVVVDNDTKSLVIGGAVERNLDDRSNEVTLVLKWMIKPDNIRVTGATGVGATSGSFLGNVARVLIAGTTGIGAQSVYNDFKRGLGQLFGGSPAPPPAPVPSKTGGPTPAGIAGNFGLWMDQPILGSDPRYGVVPPAQGMSPQATIDQSFYTDPCPPDPVQEPTGDDDSNEEDETLDPGTENATPDSVTEFTPVQIDDMSAYYINTNSNGILHESAYLAGYKDDPGTDVLPSSNGGIGGKIQIHGGFTTVDLCWSITRLGAPPENPPTQSPDANLVYLDGAVDLPHIEVAADGVTPIFSVDGVYRYQALDRTKLRVNAPKPPYLGGNVITQATQLVSQYAIANIFPGGQVGTNPFTGYGISTSELVSQGSDNG